MHPTSLCALDYSTNCLKHVVCIYVYDISLNPGQNYFRKLNFYFKNIFATYLNEAIGASSYPNAYGRISKNLVGHFTKLESSIFSLAKRKGVA